jgi:hypothetical protein
MHYAEENNRAPVSELAAAPGGKERNLIKEILGECVFCQCNIQRSL